MTNSKKKCKQCKEYCRAKDGIQVPAGFFCCFDHAVEFANLKTRQARKRQQAKVKKEARKELSNYNKNNLRWQHKRTQAAFNKMRVLEELKWFHDQGLDPECISCGKPLGGDQWCCGHFKTRGAQSNLRYDRRNTYLQHNHRCNMNLSGDIEGTKKTRGYKNGLRERFGDGEGQAIIDYCESQTSPVKWDCIGLEAFRKICNQKIRTLERERDLLTTCYNGRID